MTINWHPTAYAEISPPQIGDAATAIDAQYDRWDRNFRNRCLLACYVSAALPLGTSLYFDGLERLFYTVGAFLLTLIVCIFAWALMQDRTEGRVESMERGTPPPDEIEEIAKLAAQEPELAEVLRSWSDKGLLINNRTMKQIFDVSDLPSITEARENRIGRTAAEELAQRFTTKPKSKTEQLA